MKLKFRWNSSRSFLWNLVNYFIIKNLFTHHGKFKVGDVVRYNWKAKVQIKSAIGKKEDKNLVICNVWGIEKGNVEYTYSDNDKSSCDVFWLRKAYWWEK